MKQYDLYFGRNIDKDGMYKHVDNLAVAEFINEVVTPRFDGFTMIDSIGYWQGKQEQSFIIRIIAEETGDVYIKLSDIRQEYKKQFNQESVMLITTDVIADF